MSTAIILYPCHPPPPAKRMNKPFSNCINVILDGTDNLTPLDPGMIVAITTNNCNIDFDRSNSSFSLLLREYSSK